MLSILKKILLSFFFIVSGIVLAFVMSETVWRVKTKGLSAGLKSYFVVEPPYSVLGVNNWVISDDELGYRLNPAEDYINELSMKDNEVMIPKPASVKRILILGDSVPFTGDPTFVDLLKEKFNTDPNVEVLNASTPGYTNYQELLYLKRFGLKAEPALVVLVYVLNDNYKFLHRFNEDAKMLMTSEAQESLKINTSVDKFVSKSYVLSDLKVRLMKNKEEKQKESKYVWETSIDFNAAWKDESWPDVERQIKEMKNILEKNGSRLMVVTVPMEDQLKYYEDAQDKEYILKPQRKMQELTEKSGIPHLDLFPSFNGELSVKSVALFTDGVHLTKLGHTLAADKLYEAIKVSLTESN